MNNKGYTIMEAVIAMFLVVVMVGAVFSAVMSGRRAIATSSEREEMFYTLQSAYGMLKDCRANPISCHLNQLGCYTQNTSSEFPGDWKTCNDLFTFNFKAVCKNFEEGGVFTYAITPREGLPYWACTDPTSCIAAPNGTTDYLTVDIQAICDEED